MPYIPQSDRSLVLTHGATSSGELNYAITQLVTEYLGSSPTYVTLNAVIGALECAKLELYRRVAAPYEDRKKEENGDVYK